MARPSSWRARDSGKTRVIVHRIAYLILERATPSSAILAVTFTNKAADEMRRRVRELLGGESVEVAVHTFHAVCLRLLRRFGEDVGLRSGFSLYGEDDRRGLLRRLLREESVLDREHPLSRIAAAVSRLKHRGFGHAPGAPDPFHELVSRVASRYQEELEAVGAVDFDDLLLRGVELMECSERAQGFAERRFRHVLVDEYQDTNRVQYRLLRLLAPHGRVFVVGDEDQAIYNFRGADLRNILDFERDFPEARTIKLEVNYRSSGAILEVAGALIQQNRDRKGKRLVASLARGEKPRVRSARDDREEAAQAAETLVTLRRERPEVRAAVLLRTHAQTRVFEEELLARAIPHQVVGGVRFYERREIRDALAYARLLLNRDDDASFERVVNQPPRGVGASTLETIRQRAGEIGGSQFHAAVELLDHESLGGRARVGLTSFRELLERLGARVDRDRPAATLRAILESSGLFDALAREGEAAARERRENLDQLVAAATEYEAREPGASLAGFLDSVSLLSDVDSLSGPAPCLIMTLHAAKGLEFDVVFLAGLEEGLFPHIRAAGDASGLEEERRLFYVGMTRAKERLYLSYALERKSSYQSARRSPSRFLTEIPSGLLETEGEPRFTPSASRARATSALRPGVLVHHARFGEGRIVDASGSGKDRRVTVLFSKAGRKRLVAQYAKLEVLT